ncbi:polysaccharide deacetylase family protein [Jiangella rhizosphaerae]|uniref:polysaccharide deacetylase family protein n=1 Tax=Jiangella rhizosphaerae TaxID=2293569 RepID=UPI001314D2EA|nr:polysaccharide deacetylase family protein [Jiangella rhizosphaerae]
MSRELRAALILCLIVGVIVGAARSEPPGSTSAAAETTQQAPPKTRDRLLSLVPAAENGSAPVAEVDDAGTRRLNGRDGRTVALTFDDGPHPEQTPQVLRILREYDITATFCVVGEMARLYPKLVRDIADEGHRLCDHTISHDTSLPDRDPEVIEDEIGGTLAAIEDAAPGVDVPFYRAPGGNFAANVNEVAAGFDQVPLGWSVDPGDWRKPGARAIHDYVAEHVHPGAIVLLHDGGGDRAGTIEALPAIIETLLDAGYEFVVPRA